PLRLIDVGDEHTGPCLRIVDGGEGTGPYLALSYCWGDKDKPPLRALSTNIAEYRQALCFDLPQTSRDAVRIPRSMRVRHLWIDSLCVLQDSP
ncbi:hypothetical protein B0T14DRAFT_397274, partial [Immersiella caudata]